MPTPVLAKKERLEPVSSGRPVSDSKSNASSGIGVGTVLTIVFVVLKLTNVIDWSWWWVLAPTWGPIALVLAVIVIGFPVYLLAKRGKA